MGNVCPANRRTTRPRGSTKTSKGNMIPAAAAELCSHKNTTCNHTSTTLSNPAYRGSHSSVLIGCVDANKNPLSPAPPLTDRASTIPSNIRGCQSGTWSQRGTKVNGSHHGDNPLLRPTGIQIATKSYATLQAMAPTNNKTVHQTSFTPYYREQPRSTRIVFAYPRPAFSATNRTNTFQPVLINNSKFIKATHRTKIRKIEIPRSMVVEALSC